MIQDGLETRLLQELIKLDGLLMGNLDRDLDVQVQIPGNVCDAEAALTKLFYLFGLGLAPDEVRQKMTENLRGELSLPYPPWGRK